jgi:uncharacterized oxidoreductase
MKMTGNTILITGGGSGIGRGLAEAFRRLGNQVIIAGHREQALDEMVSKNPGMKSLALDIEDPAKIRLFADKIANQYPALNLLINNAGIMRVEELQKRQADLDDAEEDSMRLRKTFFIRFMESPSCMSDAMGTE